MAGGRPTTYKPENAEIARHACMLGATNETLAERFEVCRRTIDNWIATIPEFSDAVRQGREVADEAVVSALFARATGMEQKMTKVFCHRGQPVTANYTVQLPPDVRACIFWLRNRRPEAVAREPAVRRRGGEDDDDWVRGSKPAPNKRALTPSPRRWTQPPTPKLPKDVNPALIGAALAETAPARRAPCGDCPPCRAITPPSTPDPQGDSMEAKLAPKMPQWMVDHANKYLSSGGKEGHIYKIKPPNYGDLEVPSLLLTTTGRKSGEKYIFPLFYGKTGNSYIIVASKGGAPEHPGWYKNILANPEVEVQVGTKKMKARARTASGAERAKLWEEAIKFWPPYTDYQKKTEREIPVVVLDPVQ